MRLAEFELRVTVEVDRSGHTLMGLGSALLVAMLAMVVFGVTFAPAGAGVAAELDWVADHGIEYATTYVAAALVNLLTVASLLVLLAVLLQGHRPRLGEHVGLAFLVAYLPLTLTAYGSQFALLPALADADPAAAELWYFGADPSFPLFLAMLGYGLFGIAVLLLSPRLLQADGLLPWIAAMLILSGIASLIGFVGLATGVELIAFASTVGGAFIAPVAVMLTIIGRRRMRLG